MHKTLKGCPQISDAEYMAKLRSRCIETESGCWEMQSFRRMPRGMERHGPNYGYGLMSYRGKNWTTHRLAWRLVHGEIPKGMLVMHTCDNPPCCNPDHLKLGTNKENQLDMANKGRGRWQSRTHCKHGHDYTPENTYLYVQNGRTSRHCKTCPRIAQRLSIGWTREQAESIPSRRRSSKSSGTPA